MFLRSLVKLNNSISLRNFAPNSGEDKKKGYSPHLALSQSGISDFLLPSGYYCTCQKTEGGRHISLPSVSGPRGRLPPPLKIDAYVYR